MQLEHSPGGRKGVQGQARVMLQGGCECCSKPHLRAVNPKVVTFEDPTQRAPASLLECAIILD